MKSKKAFCLLLSLVLIVLLLGSCGLRKKDVTGIWVANYTYTGNVFVDVLQIKDDGTYTDVATKNGTFCKDKVGTWEINGNTLELRASGERGYYPYDYENGNLVMHSEGFDIVYTKK